MHSTRQRYGLLVVPFGVVAGHLVGYRLAHPDGIERRAVLGPTHDYLSVSTWATVGLAVAALGWAAVEGARGHQAGFTAGTFLRAQSLAFVALEVLERVGSADPIGDTLREPAVMIGLALQVLLAVGAAALLRVSATLGARLVAASRPTDGEADPRAAVGVQVRSAASTTAVGRGPPRTQFA